MSIVDFDVTYGDALAEVKYHRATDTEGMGADVNPGGPSVYVWWRAAEDGEPVTAVRVVDAEAETPQGWTTVRKPLLRGQGSRYLCFARGGEERPVRCIKILYGDERMGARSAARPPESGQI